MVLLDKLTELQNLRGQRALLEDQNKIEFIRKEKALKKLEKSSSNILFSNPEKVKQGMFFQEGRKKKE